MKDYYQFFVEAEINIIKKKYGILIPYFVEVLIANSLTNIKYKHQISNVKM